MDLVLGGPAGLRSFGVPLAPQPEKVESDLCGVDRRLFFASVKQLRSRLKIHGITDDGLRSYFASRYGSSRMRKCNQLEWSLAAAEVHGACRSLELFSVLVENVKGGR